MQNWTDLLESSVQVLTNLGALGIPGAAFWQIPSENGILGVS